MKQLFLIAFSLLSTAAFGSSCCVSNTSVSNLMIFPAKWQETFTLSHARVIGDVNSTGTSTFRNNNNKDTTQLARLELAYGWTDRYQTGLSFRYQNRDRELNGTRANNSGWNDIGLSQAYKLKAFNRLWVFQTLNIPTAKSIYNSQAALAVDAQGTGTYASSVGVFGIHNLKDWDFIYSSEVHHSFARTFEQNNSKTEVGGFWGTSMTGGVGYIPWRSKARYGLNLTPRFEGAKQIVADGTRTPSRQSVVWDSSVNVTYTFNAENALGVNYLDQTLFGPARNTLLNRSISFLFQTRWL